MGDFGFKFVPKQLFFDHRRVLDALDKGKHKALSKAGAFVRTRVRTVLNKKARNAHDHALPGQPPKRHIGLLRDFIFFAYEPSNSAVVIGPVAFNRGEAPHALEFGGQVTARIRGRKTRMNIHPHPYMGPSLRAEVEAGTIAPAWRNCVSGG